MERNQEHKREHFLVFTIRKVTKNTVQKCISPLNESGVRELEVAFMAGSQAFLAVGSGSCSWMGGRDADLRRT